MDYAHTLAVLGSSLRTMRQARGLTQQQLAARAGVTRLRVIQVEAGKPTVSAEAYARVAAGLDATLAVAPGSRPTLDEIREILK